MEKFTPLAKISHCRNFVLFSSSEVYHRWVEFPGWFVAISLTAIIPLAGLRWIGLERLGNTKKLDHKPRLHLIGIPQETDFFTRPTK